jgi:hypothetical protein
MNVNKTLIAVLGTFVGFIFITVIAIALNFMGVYNQAISFENGIKANYSNNQNVYDNYTKKVMEAAQIPNKYANDLKGLYSEAIGKRYGKEGSKAMFQWLQEHNPTLDPSIYKEIQVIIENGRDEFKVNQSSLIERKREYDIFLTTFPNNVITGMLKFPKIDLSKYDIVTSDDTDKVFQDKKSEPLKVF